MLQAKSVPMNGQTNTLTADGHRTDESKLAVEVLLAKGIFAMMYPFPLDSTDGLLKLLSIEVRKRIFARMYRFP